ncbi:uncharacterized protein LOC120573536 [Perca fluviatilis]|uniref:uncharacterized protein LOC120573536 n=1 Tax=Perca fluviatilis TaxID=8168 RepID=UPI001966AA85|nr:uncharacterized protein LOC120573536 [Perca fluviatilis]
MEHILQDPDSTKRRISARQAEGVRKPAAQCPCCKDSQVPHSKRKRPHSAARGDRPQKRKRTSVARPPKPSAENPASEVSNWGPSPQPSTPAVDIAGLLGLVPKLEATISPSDLPVASTVAPSLQPSAVLPHHDEPLKIHNRSVEEYQQIYHEVVDDMLRYKSGKLRPYSLDLGRRIKQKLWERLDRPTFSETVAEDGRVHVDVSYGVGVYPPLYEVDISGEPEPETPPRKRANKSIIVKSVHNVGDSV